MLIETSIDEVKSVTFVRKYPTSVEENIAISVCENARKSLTSLFGKLEHRQITTKELIEVKKSTDKDYASLVPIISAYLSVGYFRDKKITPEMLLSELKAYDYFIWRNVRLRHFAHIFKDVAKGLLTSLHNK